MIYVVRVTTLRLQFLILEQFELKHIHESLIKVLDPSSTSLFVSLIRVGAALLTMDNQAIREVLEYFLLL